MQENKNLVQEALLQMKNVEEAIAENAKGILASTMKEEINQLVKESLSDDDDESEVETDVDMDIEDIESDDMGMDTEEDETDMELDMDDESEESPIDLTHASDEEVIRVFKAMSDEDGIIVKKDGDEIHLKDNKQDSEYLIKLDESEEEMDEMYMDEIDEEEMGDVETQKVIDAIFSKDGGIDLDETESEEDEVMYEIEFDEEDMEMDEIDEMDEEDMEMDEIDEMDEEDMEMDEIDEMDEEDMEMDEEYESIDEAYDHKRAKKSETKESKKMSIKPKGLGLGSGPKFKYKDKAAGGFNEDKKEGPKTMGTGKAKFEYKKGANMEEKSKVVKKAETKEAARTLGNGSRNYAKRKSLPKLKVVPNKSIKESTIENLEAEVAMLRSKNEEYRKALNVFREKLNEVAIFNSNLAYATRLFTEHSTTKKEKINILRRFDGVESLKESKSLYKSLKEELTKTDGKSLNESVERKLNKTVSSGSAVNLIESKTYENPQFMRMKDLMSKLG